MPAARHISRSPCIALAVIATMRGRSSGDQLRGDLARGLEAVHLGHLHVHQHHVVGLALHRLDGLDAVRREVGAVAHLLQDAAARASGSRRCPRPAGCAADGARPCSGSSWHLAGAAAAFGRRVARQQADQRVEELRLADRLARGRRRRARRRSPASRRPSELNSTSGSAAPALADLAGPARRRPSPACACRGSRGRTARRASSQRSASCGRLGGARLPCPTCRPAARARAGWWRCRRRRARACPAARAARRRSRAGGPAAASAIGASIVKQNVDPLPGPVALAPTCARPSARRGAC